ncbi:hypothetical protein FRC03_002478 [Tulasnella sp. 419]|nr:hypothetical protein FRC03_002478 [Tulasnella sp. 419]
MWLRSVPIQLENLFTLDRMSPEPPLIRSETPTLALGSSLSVISGVLIVIGILIFMVLVTVVGSWIQPNLLEAFEVVIEWARATLRNQRRPRPGDEENPLQPVRRAGAIWGPGERIPNVVLTHNENISPPSQHSSQTSIQESIPGSNTPMAVEPSPSNTLVELSLQSPPRHIGSPVTRATNFQRLTGFGPARIGWFLC